MAKEDLTSFIIPVVLDNTDEHQRSGDKKFRTEDLIYLDSYDEVRKIPQDERIISPTDYAIANGAFQYWRMVSRTGKEGTSNYWLRSASYGRDGALVSCDGMNGARARVEGI